MKILSDFRDYHMKIDTSSERIWIAFNDEEISSRFVFFGRYFWTSQNVMLPNIHTAYEFVYIVGGTDN